MFVLELYDKDNDVLEPVIYSENIYRLQEYGKVIDSLLRNDRIVRYCSDGTKEPFDYYIIREVEKEEELEKDIPHI